MSDTPPSSGPSYGAEALTLAIETSTSNGGVALLEGDDVLGETVSNRPRGHAKHLLTDAISLMRTHGVEAADLDLIVGGIGPGAFTGIRLALATVRALGWAQSTPCVGVGSLKVLAWGASVAGGVVAPMLDARKRQVYGAVYELGDAGEPPQELHPPGVFDPGAFAAVLESYRSTGVRWVGEGGRAYAEAFAGFAGLAGPQVHAMRPALAGLLGLRAARAGQAGTYAEMVPQYFRASEAEENMGPPTGDAQVIDLQVST